MYLSWNLLGRAMPPKESPVHWRSTAYECNRVFYGLWCCIVCHTRLSFVGGMGVRQLSNR